MNDHIPNPENKETTKATVPDDGSSIGKEWEVGSENISLEQICFVRAVNEIEGIDINKKGEIILPNLATRTKGKIPRLTAHTAINHLVQSHHWGSWFAPEVTVIMPGEQTVKENGVPQNLRHADSFWYGDIIIPEGSMLIWKNEIPEKFKGNRFKNVELRTPESVLKKLTDLQEAYDKEEVHEERVRIGNEQYALQEKLESNLQGVVGQHIEELGYTHLPGDNGVYSVHKNLDHAIHNLSEKLNITSSFIHADTASKHFEELNLLAKYFTRPEQREELTSEVVRKDLWRYQSLLRDVDLSEDDFNMVRIFASELLYWMKENIMEIKENRLFKEDLDIFLEENPDFKNLLTNYSTTDKELQEIITHY